MRKEDFNLIRFATIVCVICSLLLAFAASALKERRLLNEKIDRLSNVLTAFGMEVRDDAGKRVMSGEEVLTYFEGENPPIVEVLIDEEGTLLEGKSRADFKEEIVDSETEAPFPLYRWVKESGSVSYCFPMSGKGLWSTIYSYMALNENLRTIKGVTFFGHAETPGLGGECSKPWFMNNFKGKTLVNDQGQLVDFTVAKGDVDDDLPSTVDGMAGATITAKGIQKFINEDIVKYKRYFDNVKGGFDMASAKSIVVDPLSENNPITVQMLGICSALAVTAQVNTAVVLSIAVIIVMCFSNTIVSMMRNIIPAKIRMIVEMAVIASLVILVDQVLKAFAYDVSKQLSVFVGLIITNCIVMGRAEAFALQNSPWPSFLDGLGNAMGYSIILVIVASFREVLGAGSWNGIQVLPDAYMGNGLAVLAPGAFIIIGLLIWVQRTIVPSLVEED